MSGNAEYFFVDDIWGMLSVIRGKIYNMSWFQTIETQFQIPRCLKVVYFLNCLQVEIG